MKLGASGVQVTHRLGIGCRRFKRGGFLNLREIHPGAAQKTRFFVGVVGNDFQR